ncbi:golgin candidate 1-like isoform X1 [Chenopodium quinoa]|uniref:golgin candidate 1-like isoform X1 n=1 Tax=Chenopodium quinoa TaxID=63459 RepID=UPI000B786D57|nr:golgin candidate 1-like isoform X1 [Chenopodium quinoa]
MDSWLKRAEGLFEVVDRRAKLVANELSDEQSNVPQPASNGKGPQGKRSKAKAKRRASMEERVRKGESAQEESSIQPSVSDLKSDKTGTSTTVENNGLTRGNSTAQIKIEMEDNIDNDFHVNAAISDASSNEVSNNDGQGKAATSDELVTSSLNVEIGSDNIPSTASAAASTEASLNSNHSIDSGQSIGVKDADDSVKKPEEEKFQSTVDITPIPVNADIKKVNTVDVTPEPVSTSFKKEDEKARTSPNKVQEQLEEAQGLLQSTNTTGQSKEARLARVCAGLSSRLQEYKSENAQLEELLTSERELSKFSESRIKQLQQELSAAKTEVNRVESNMAEALAAKNSEIETLVSSVEALKKQAALSEGNLASLQANMEALMRNRELTETRMMQALKEELALAERRAEEERAAHNATKKAAMEREVELEHRAVDASTGLARLQRMADERTAKAGELEQKVALLEAECASLNQELQDMESRLRREQKKSPEDPSQLIQIQTWQQEVERARQGQRDAEIKISSLDAELQKMRVEMAAMKRDAEHYSRQEHMELEKRYRELTDLLYYKQTQLETMASEKAAAEFQLEKEIKRLQEVQAEAERNKISRRASTTWDEETDMRELEPLPLHQRHLVGASMQLRKAAKLLDSGAVSATRILWRHPRARVGLLCYLVFVHMFLMYLLHRLQAQADDFAAQDVARSMGLSQPNLP